MAAGAEHASLFTFAAAPSGAGKRLLAGGLGPSHEHMSRPRWVPGSNLEPEALPFQASPGSAPASEESFVLFLATPHMGKLRFPETLLPVAKAPLGPTPGLEGSAKR